MRIATLALASIAFALVAAPGCFLFGHKVSKEDCDKWAGQYEKTVTAEAEKACKGDKAKIKQAKKSLATVKDAQLQACNATAGVTPVEKKDEDCFMNAKGTKDWDKCGLTGTSAVFMFGGTADAARAVYATCDGASSDDDDGTQKASKGDDDDSPKKKKKKAAADDDDDKGGW